MKIAKNIAQFPISINDLKDRYFAGESLTFNEINAIKNYDKYRLDYLNTAATGIEFDQRYFELQAKANLAPYSDFL